MSFPQYGQPRDLVPPEVSIAKQELCSARSPGMVTGEAWEGVRHRETDVCCMLIKAVFLLQNRSPLICCHGNVNKHLALLALLFEQPPPKNSGSEVEKSLRDNQIPSLPPGKTVSKPAPTTWGGDQERGLGLSLPTSSQDASHRRLACRFLIGVFLFP